MPIANLSAAKITSGKLARARLAFGTFDVTGNTTTVATLTEYAFFPNIRGCTGSNVTLKGRSVRNPTSDHRTGAVYVVLDGACQDVATWAVKGSYLSASDRPSVPLEPTGDGVTGMPRDSGGRGKAHAFDAQAGDLLELPSRAAKTAVRGPRVCADGSPADGASVPLPSAGLCRK